MARAEVNGIRIEYDTFGPGSARPLVLVMGLASQMVGWPTAFCHKLVEQGHYVVRFDNRDVGLSSKIRGRTAPSLEAILTGAVTGKEGGAPLPYTLSDMAADTRELLRALGIPRAHVCGISMGGMIAQILAIEHPDCVASLTSLESTTGEAHLPPPSPEAAAVLLEAPPTARDAYIRHMARVYRTFAGGSALFDEALQREILALAYDRCFYPAGFLRQMAAILAAGSRREKLGALTVPTLVIHGSMDPLIPPEHGRATARAVPGARIQIVEGLGHGIAFPALWDEIVARIAQHTARAA